MASESTEIALMCDCGNKDSVSMLEGHDAISTSAGWYHPECSLECGRRMRPVTCEELAHLLKQITDAADPS